MSRTLAVISLFLGLCASACSGKDPYIGTYELDAKAMIAAMRDQLPKETTEEQMKQAVETMEKSIKGTMEIQADNKVVVDMTMPMMGPVKEEGTWKRDAAAIVITTKDGKNLTGELKDGALTLKDGTSPMQMVFRRK